MMIQYRDYLYRLSQRS